MPALPVEHAGGVLTPAAVAFVEVFMADFEDANSPTWANVVAEISRTKIWQWLEHRATLDDGRTVTRPVVEQLIGEEPARVLRVRHPAGLTSCLPAKA